MTNDTMETEDNKMLTSEDMEGMSQVLQPREESTMQKVICRKGNTDDIVKEQDVVDKSKPKKNVAKNDPTSYADASANSYCFYGQQDFEREFNDEDEEDIFEKDSRKMINNFSVTECDHVNVEDTAGSMSAADIFAEAKNSYYILRVELPNEDPKTIDIDVHGDKIIVYSHQYKLRTYFPRHVSPTSTKSKFYKDKNLLEVSVRQS